MPSIYAHFKYGNEVKKLLKKDESTSKEYAVIEKYPKTISFALKQFSIIFTVGIIFIDKFCVQYFIYLI